MNGGQTGIDDRRYWLGRTKVIWLAPLVATSLLSSRAVANLDASVSDATNTGTVVASVSAGSFAARAAQTALDQWQKFGNQTYDIAGHATQIGHKEGEDAWHKYFGQYWKEGVGNDTLTGLDHSVPWSAAFVSWVMRTSGRWAQPPTQRKWLAEVKRCRIDGNGVDFGNLLAGITTIAAPVPDAAGKPTHRVGAAGIAEVMGLNRYRRRKSCCCGS